MQCADAGSFIDAGPFGAWLRQARESLHGNGGMDVPCGTCTGCCTSGYSVQLRPEDRGALAKIPVQWLVAAAGFASGHRTLPALSSGHCPMLSEGGCTIYHVRPQTCIDYDCRIFAAAGIEAGGPGKAVINKRVRAWRFAYPGEVDRLEHEAVRAAAQFIRERGDRFSVPVPASPMGIAVLAIKTYTVFLKAPIDMQNVAKIAAQIVETDGNFMKES